MPDFHIEEIFTIEELETAYGYDVFESATLQLRDWRLKDIVYLRSARAGPPIVPSGREPFLPGYWDACKNEFRIFLCTDDDKYATVRRELRKHAGKSQTVLVGTISAAIGATVGVVAGALTPLVALCLIVALKIGKEAYCKAVDIDSIKPFVH